MDGFIVYNDAGIEQISQNGWNLSFIKRVAITSGQWSAISGPNGAAGKQYSFTVTGISQPVLAFATNVAGQNGAVAYKATQSGSTLTVLLYAGIAAFGATTYVYVYDRVLPANASTYGLHVMDAAGNMIFDSAYPPARVISYLKSYTGWPTTGPASVTPPAGKTYAIIPGFYGWTRYVGSHNVVTGDIVANDFLYGVAGGVGVAASCYGASAYECFKQAQPLPNGTPAGSPGAIIYTSGLLSGALVLDVSGLQ